MRQYSLCNDPADTAAYVIAVKREPQGQGGSVSLIEKVRAGDEIDISEPRNDFELRPNVGRVILIAGGIGITPILCMARALNRRGADFHLYYLTRSPELTAFQDEILASPFADRVIFHHDYGDPTRSLNLGAILAEPGDAVVYCCGPTGLLRAVRERTGHWPKGSVCFEDFGTSAPSPESNSTSFTVTLADGRGSYLVPPDKTILQVLQEAGLDVPSSCEAGTCGTCRMRLVSGEADHRDLVLFDDEMEGNIIICCSRAKSAEIVIAPPEWAVAQDE
jgi:phthalate 4,5-dioxygenase reductase subunit